jgi:hypothetical protein
MTPSDVRSEVSRLNVTLLESNVAINVNGSVLKRNGSNVLVTWPNASLSALSDHVFGSLQEYRHFLRHREYTALLTDGALLQLSYSFDHDDVVGHRLCYYPCPLVLKSGGTSASFIDDFDDQLAGELEAQHAVLYASSRVDPIFGLRLRGPLRFDFDARNYSPHHSASHLHLLQDDSRWPIYGPVSIGHFVRFVFRHFYPYLEVAALREWPLRHGGRTVTASEEYELFIECRQQLR